MGTLYVNTFLLRYTVFSVRGMAVVAGPGIMGDGRVVEQLMAGVDWLPTLAAAAGVKIRPILPLDGVNQWGVLKGNGGLPRDSVVHGNCTNYCTDGGFAVAYVEVSGAWKLIKTSGGIPSGWCNLTATGLSCKKPAGNGPEASCAGGWCLFDTRADPAEERPLRTDGPHSEVFRKLKNLLRTALDSYVQYRIDPSCGPAMFGNDSKVGKVWQPWC